MSLRRACAWLPAATLLLASAFHPAATRGEVADVAPAERSAIASSEGVAVSAASLSALSYMLQHERPERRRAAIAELRALGAEALPALGVHLRELGRIGVDGRGLAPKLAQLRRLQRAQRSSAGPTVASLAAALTSDRSTAMRHAVELLSIHNALLAQHTVEAAEVLVGDLFRLGPNALRAEAVRARKQLGALLAPAYLRHAASPDPAMRRLCRAALAALGMTTPRQAFQHAEPAVLPALLQVYGELRAMEALPWLVTYLGDPRSSIDAAARTATAEFGDDALPRLRERYLRIVHSAAADHWGAARILAELEAHASTTSERATLAHVEAAESALSAGKLADAERSLDLALRQPRSAALGKRIAAAYVSLAARQRSASDLPAALTALRRAMRTDLSPELQTTARARVLQLEAELRLTDGVADLNTLSAALALDPTLARAGELLRELSGARAAEALAWRRRAGIAAAVLLALSAALLLRDAKQRRERDQRPRLG